MGWLIEREWAGGHSDEGYDARSSHLGCQDDHSTPAAAPAVDVWDNTDRIRMNQ